MKMGTRKTSAISRKTSANSRKRPQIKKVLVLIFRVEHFLVFHLIVFNLSILGTQKPGSQSVGPFMFPLRSCSTFMAGAPALERKLTGVEGTVDVDAAIQVSWICFRDRKLIFIFCKFHHIRLIFKRFYIPPHLTYK